MAKVYIHQIETLVPEHRYAQATAAERLAGLMPEPRMGRVVRQIFRKSGIDYRHSILPDFLPGHEARLFVPGPDGRPIDPSTEARNRCYIQAADVMAVELARRTLGAGPFLPADLTHLITVSCTGFYNPGPDYRIVTELGLPHAIQRYHLGFMGCYAAFPALRMAAQFCQAQSDAVVLVLCLELCSVHMHIDGGLDAILGSALFADGAAAAIVSARPPAHEQPALELLRFDSALAPEGRQAMAWDIGNSGFNLALSSYVPAILGANIRGIVQPMLARHRLDLDAVDLWAVHPGGRAILDAVAQALDLAPEQLAASREVLRRYGNMSSATILFVLRALLQTYGSAPATLCAMAFGPGLTIETALLELAPAPTAATPMPPPLQREPVPV